MSGIRWSPESLRDLESIRDSIAQDSPAYRAAYRVVYRVGDEVAEVVTVFRASRLLNLSMD